MASLGRFCPWHLVTCVPLPFLSIHLLSPASLGLASCMSPTCQAHLEPQFYPPRFRYSSDFMTFSHEGSVYSIPSSRPLMGTFTSPGHRPDPLTHHLCLPGLWHAVINYSLGEVWGTAEDTTPLPFLNMETSAVWACGGSFT